MTRFASAAFAFAASFLSFAVTLPVQAQAPGQGPDIRVSAAGLDLASRAGVRTLDARISAAAERACGWEDGTRDLGLIRLSKACAAAKVAEAQAARATLVAAATSRPAAVTAAR